MNSKAGWIPLIDSIWKEIKTLNYSFLWHCEQTTGSLCTLTPLPPKNLCESVQAMTVVNFSKAIEMEQNQNIKIFSNPTWPDMIFHLVWVPGVKKKKKSSYFESYFKCSRELLYFKKKYYGGCFRNTNRSTDLFFFNVDFWSLICLSYLISNRFWL